MYRRLIESGVISSIRMRINTNGVQLRNFSQNKNDKNSFRFLVTGSGGQIGQELVPFLRERFGVSNVIATDVKLPPRPFVESGPFYYLDVTKHDQIARTVVDHRITHVIHLAALLSAVGEKNPLLALEVNNTGTENVLEVSRDNRLNVFIPSTIAVFGPSSPKENTPNLTILRPTTMYGITKVHTELLGEYYHRKYGLNFRSLRYPGVISAHAFPGGGTTDYAVEIYYEAILHKRYNCFLGPNAALPMMYMPDLLHATLSFIEAPEEQLTERVYNLTSMSFTPAELATTIKEFIPEFEISYNPDFRQKIADSWPRSIDDSEARKDWGWNPKYDIRSMSKEVIEILSMKLKNTSK